MNLPSRDLSSVDGIAFGREMFEQSLDVSHVSAGDLVVRDLKEYEVAPGLLAAAGAA